PEQVTSHVSSSKASESVSVSIPTQTTSTLVFSQTSPASLVGVVTASWKIPVNATIDSYMVTVSGTSTFKTPLDAQHFTVNAATMSVATIAIFKPIYRRTETMRFSFQPTYPDASLSSTGVGLLTLATLSGSKITLTATYNSNAQALK